MSEWKEDSAKRRDFRQTHNGPEVAKPKSRPKKGCKRNEGKPHVYSKFVRAYPSWTPKFKGWEVIACEYCGKQRWVVIE